MHFLYENLFSYSFSYLIHSCSFFGALYVLFYFLFSHLLLCLRCCGSFDIMLSCLALPCLALPCLVLPCLALPCLALPCLALSCLALPCLALPCLALPCLALPCLALPCLVLSCPVLSYPFTRFVFLFLSTYLILPKPTFSTLSSRDQCLLT
jgi:hypothetical protein